MRVSVSFLLLIIMVSCVGGQAEPDERVETLWLKNVSTVQAAINGSFRSHELEASLRFFQNLTGIPSRVEGNYIGPLPTENLSEDLAQWNKWYDDHVEELCWDEDRERIMLCRGAADP